MQENRSNCKYCGAPIYWQQMLVEMRWKAFDDAAGEQPHKTTCSNFGVAHRFKQDEVILFKQPSHIDYKRSAWEKDTILYKIREVVGDAGNLKYVMLQYGPYGFWDKERSGKGYNKTAPCKFIDKYSTKVEEEMAVALYG